MKAAPTLEDNWLWVMLRGQDGIPREGSPTCSRPWVPWREGQGPQPRGCVGLVWGTAGGQCPGGTPGRHAPPAPLWAKGSESCSAGASAPNAFISFPFPSGQGKHFFDM